jgi:uncharacterized membrane protein YgcG
MPLATTTLATLRSLARDLADMHNTDFVAANELDLYINLGVKELYDLFAEAHGQEFFLKTVEIPLAPPVNCYDLPDDFHVLKGVDIRESPFPSNVLDGWTHWVMPYDVDRVNVIKPYMFYQRHRGAHRDEQHRIATVGDRMRFRVFTEMRSLTTATPGVCPVDSCDAPSEGGLLQGITEEGVALVTVVSDLPEPPLKEIGSCVYFEGCHGFVYVGQVVDAVRSPSGNSNYYVQLEPSLGGSLPECCRCGTAPPDEFDVELSEIGVDVYEAQGRIFLSITGNVAGGGGDMGGGGDGGGGGGFVGGDGDGGGGLDGHCVWFGGLGLSGFVTPLGTVHSYTPSGETGTVVVDTGLPWDPEFFLDESSSTEIGIGPACGPCANYRVQFLAESDGVFLFQALGSVTSETFSVGDVVEDFGVITDVIQSDGNILIAITADGSPPTEFAEGYEYQLRICNNPETVWRVCPPPADIVTVAREYAHRIRFQPIRRGYALVWYLPEHPRLEADTDGLVGFHGYEEYPAIFAAMRMLRKEESDFQGVMADLEQMKARIRGMAANRDMGHPDVAQDFEEDA